MLVALLVAAPASAATIPSACHAFSPESTTYAELARQPSRWICRSVHWADRQPVAWLRFDAAGWRETGIPKSFVSRVAKFEQLDILVIGADGTAKATSLKTGEATPRAGGSVFAAPLPEIPADTQAVVIRIVHPWNAGLLAEGKLSAKKGGEGWPVWQLVLAAILVGLLTAPPIYDLVLYRTAIRERFVLLHAALTLALAAYVMTITGLSSLFLDMSVTTHARLDGASITVVVALATLFTADLFEPYALSRRMRAALRVASAFVLLVSGTAALFPPFLDFTAQTYFYLGFLPSFAILFAAIAQALRRGSRMAKFQFVAWSPIILCGLERIARGLGLYGAPPFVDTLLYFTLLSEVVVSVMGIADRMMTLKQQRDTARAEVRMLASLAEHDPLTGLYNRRAIEPHFSTLAKEGFTTFALIDLDHFKAVNDQHGHTMGDAVLRAAAQALAPDEDTLAMRLGGEEFLLLLRGRKARQRAEQRRQALSRHISRQVPTLTSPVTASMGVIEGAIETLEAETFADLYERADKLLYEAKMAGRNRTISEKLTLFLPRRKDRRHQEDRRHAA
ncbi:MAG: GGDEF domain-containing protein [Novosphingobium sp.]|nr:GGDEF domain-containing protein [Novosphingobium sp.]